MGFSLSDILDWLEENQPVYTDQLRDYFGVNDLHAEVDEDELLDAICDNDSIFEMLSQEFSGFDGTVVAATNCCGITPKLDVVTSSYDDWKVSPEYEDLMEAVEEEIGGTDPRHIHYYEYKDTIYLNVVNYLNRLHEYAIPKADLTGTFQENLDYIVQYVLSDIDLN